MSLIAKDGPSPSLLYASLSRKNEHNYENSSLLCNKFMHSVYIVA